MGFTEMVVVHLDASIVKQARAQLAKTAIADDGAVIERAVNTYLSRCMAEAIQAAVRLSDQ
jgi:hypothetical protein